MNLDLTSLLTSFTIVFLAELGDKTQICTIILSSRTSASKVFLGAMSAFFVVDGLSALIGGSILSFISHSTISIIAGLVFIVFGLISIKKNNRDEYLKCDKTSFLNTFILISLMELGDKTQLASMLMAATFNNPIIVLCGIMLAFSIITAVGVLFGSKCLNLIPKEYLRIVSSLIFILFGLTLIIEGLITS